MKVGGNASSLRVDQSHTPVIRICLFPYLLPMGEVPMIIGLIIIN